MASEIKVYGKPDCYGCKATMKKLGQMQERGTLHTPVQYIDITVNEVAYQAVKDLGYQSVPVVVAPDGRHWAGYSPDKVGSLEE